MTTPTWAHTALASVLARAARTHTEATPRFPLSAAPDTGRWTTTRNGSWTGGFWAALLRLRARHTRAASDRAAAADCTARLARWATADTATRGLILWYGTALAADDPAATALKARAAEACHAAYDPELGLVPWGEAFGGPRHVARADAAPGLVPLLATAGPRPAATAAAHLRRHLVLCRAGALAWRHEPATGWRPLTDPPPGWSRGEAWLLLAVADALLHLPPRLSDRFHEEARRRTAAPGALVPPADRADPDGPLDTSAAAITAVALLKLGHLPGPEGAAHRRRGEAVLRRLVEAHLTRGSANGTARPAGMLLDGCHDAASGTAVRHELIWGDFFLALGLALLTGLVDAREI
ncbi:sugar ABC transporter permease [Streptomyces sp. G45]|uniref:sugar ABC transporter permease n=1 Tax=Streptomyces sp. G45 TaxID=3406627 RepID=UPI003C13EE6D